MHAENVAVFVDLENVGSPFIQPTAEFAATQGRVCHLAVYADWRRGYQQAWNTTLDLGGVPTQILRASGKNSADIAIVVDAIEFMYLSPAVRTFVLATGDSDFVPLAHRLRQRGKTVIGVAPMGRAVTDALIAACDRFEHLDVDRSDDERSELVVADPAPEATGPQAAPTLEQFRAVLLEYLRPRDSVTAGAIGMHLLKLMPNFRYRDLGHRTLSDLLRAQDDLLVVVPTAHELRVSLLPGAHTPEGEKAEPIVFAGESGEPGGTPSAEPAAAGAALEAIAAEVPQVAEAIPVTEPAEPPRKVRRARAPKAAVAANPQ